MGAPEIKERMRQMHYLKDTGQIFQINEKQQVIKKCYKHQAG